MSRAGLVGRIKGTLIVLLLGLDLFLANVLSPKNDVSATVVVLAFLPITLILLDVFWHNIDPTQRNAQFCDHGSQYRSAIFYQGEEQKRLAEASRAALEKSKPFKGEIVTQIVPAGAFYPAEDYHQDFYRKNPVRYKYYKTGCGRAARLKELWG